MDVVGGAWRGYSRHVEVEYSFPSFTNCARGSRAVSISCAAGEILAEHFNSQNIAFELDFFQSCAISLVPDTINVEILSVVQYNRVRVSIGGSHDEVFLARILSDHD